MVLLAQAAAAAGLRAAHTWVVWTVSILLFLLLFLLSFPFRILFFFLFLFLVIRIRWCFWGDRILGTALFVLVLVLLLGRLNVHQTTLLRQRASVEAETSQHGPCDRIERATENRGLLDEGAEAAVIMGTRQINHPWQVRQEVTQLLLHFLPTKFIIVMFQVVVCDQIGAACQLGATWQFPH